MRSWMIEFFGIFIKLSASPLLASCPLDNLWKSLVSGDNTGAVNIKKGDRLYRNITNPFQQITSMMFGGGGDARADITTNLLHKQLELAVGVSSAILAILAEHSSIMRVTETLGGRGRLFCCVLYLLQTSTKSCHARWHSLPLNL